MTRFRLAKIADVPGYVRIDLLVDGPHVGDYTFLLLPEDEKVLLINDVIGLAGCDAQAVSVRIGAISRA